MLRKKRYRQIKTTAAVMVPVTSQKTRLLMDPLKLSAKYYIHNTIRQ